MIVTQILKTNDRYTFALKSFYDGKLNDVCVYSYANCAEAYSMHQKVKLVGMLANLGN